MKIGKAIQQDKFDNAQEQAGMNLIFTANWLSAKYAAALKPLDLSLQQLNVLSILKGQPKQTAAVNLIRERMIDRMPNVSRLINKLMEKGLVEKDRQYTDQRVVHVRLTTAGIKTCEQGRAIFASVHHSLSKAQALQLNNLLDQMRD